MSVATAYLRLVLFRKDQIFGVVVLQTCNILTDLLPNFHTADVVHELFENLGLVVGFVDRYRDVDFIQRVFLRQIRYGDFSCIFLVFLVVENLSLPLEYEIPFVEEDELSFPVVCRRFAIEFVEFYNCTR